MKDTIKLKIEYQSCSGTGLYVGMAEKDGDCDIAQIEENTQCLSPDLEYELIQQQEDLYGDL
ncbi:hypothetical protein LCGC14_2158000 [marine sediment metagenome]|uniref:Uncharacterized protein n=1 Tax=marine sediment metagenome TaxID=412755 RepID=A0A0F9GPN8_9ZZZZ